MMVKVDTDKVFLVPKRKVVVAVHLMGAVISFLMSVSLSCGVYR